MNRQMQSLIWSMLKLVALFGVLYVVWVLVAPHTTAFRRSSFWSFAKLPLVVVAGALAWQAIKELFISSTNQLIWMVWGIGAALMVGVWAIDGYGLLTGAILYAGLTLLFVVWNVLSRGVTWIKNFDKGFDPRTRNKPYDAHFADAAEQKPLLMPFASSALGGALLLAETQTPSKQVLALQAGATGGRRELGHALIVGPSRSGKGLHLMSQLLTWRGSAVVVDIKGEMFAATAGERSKHGRILVLDPNGRGARYDPFKDLGATSESLYAAAALVLESDKDGANAIFGQRATAALFAALRAAILERVPTIPYVRNVTKSGLLAFAKTLAAVGDDQVTTALVDFLGKPPEKLTDEDISRDRFLVSSWQNLITKLRPMFSEGILAMTSASDFKATDLIDGSTTLYLIFRESDLEFTGRALALIELAMINTLIREYDINPKRAGVPVLYAFDEAGRVPVPKLPELVSTVAGRGMSALIYIQDLAQLESAYGRDGAPTIRNNCHTQIFYRPQDEQTGKYITNKLGLTSFVDVSMSEGTSRSTPKGGDILTAIIGDVTTSQGTSMKWSQRELATADELRQMSPESVLLFVGELPPIIGTRLKPFIQQQLKPLLNLEPPAIAALKPPPQGRILNVVESSPVNNEGNPEDDQVPVQPKPKPDEWFEPPEELN
jgi:type IV secretion system protein VirD4